ncbi:ABC transporter ATP-binding protein [Aeromicrobium chenweiae]|uniref:ABC transporter ATP-binding protein n=2 Tax=Aeromicrobium chenweiae TaxID=2079793 RepID=A0A2S0WHX4_9ACTN|nr:ABC transporter ATP-binding protein [Aeromicrobium chenweiae]TGN32200.1 ABC transporter ATP-binding protein [Aeromicrobium chenweiae]
MPTGGVASATATAEPKIALRGVSRLFGKSAAVDNVSLEIEDGEFFVLLGPSGCGKSTLLRMIAGLQPVSSGVIEIDGRAAQDMEADERDLAFVFQNYALYPHMSVRRNMSFPLLMRRFRWWHHIPVVGWIVRRRLMRSPEIADVIDRIAETLGLTEMLDRLPATLSGGQRQRVALGRAMVREPLAFLMDEPLSNLDAKLRAQTRSELIRFHRLLKTTIVYVTHDQVEAMTMGDKIGVMKDGVLQQVGTPRAVYENPANTFVAQFIGTPAMNMLPAVATGAGVWRVAGQDVAVDTTAAGSAHLSTEIATDFLLGVRSEWVEIVEPTQNCQFQGQVAAVEDWGAEQLVRIHLDAGPASDADAQTVLDVDAHALDVRVPSHRLVKIGQQVGVRVDLERTRRFDPVTGDALISD